MNYKECREACKKATELAPEGVFYSPSNHFLAQLFEAQDGYSYWLPAGILAISPEILKTMLIPENRATDEELNGGWFMVERNIDDF